MVIVPEAFATDTIAREGEDGRFWITSLPQIIELLCQKWHLVVDGSSQHGYLGLVVPVWQGDERFVLKVSWLDEVTQEEAAALIAWDGQGAVRLLAHEPDAGAMLLEGLDFDRSLQDVAIGEAVTVAGHLLRRLAIPAVEGFRPLSVAAPMIANSLQERWAANGRPFSRYLPDKARDDALQLSHHTASLLVNYDLHYADVLAGEREPWLVVDLKAVIGDPEYGLAQLLWTRLEDIQANGGLDRHFRLLVEAAALDEPLARAWTLVRCVDYWLWGLSVGLTEDPVRCAAIVDWLG